MDNNQNNQNQNNNQTPNRPKGRSPFTSFGMYI